MIISLVRFHNCEAETLKIDFKRHEINPVPLKKIALSPVPFIFWNLECIPYTLKNIPLSYKAQIKSTKKKHQKKAE